MVGFRVVCWVSLCSPAFVVGFPHPPAPSPRFAGGEGESYQCSASARGRCPIHKTPPLPQRSGERGPGKETNDEGREQRETSTSPRQPPRSARTGR